jgi:Protein of unknown function (DUF3014)
MIDRPDGLDEQVINKPLIGVAAAVVIAALGGWYYWHSHHAPVPPPTAEVAPAPAAAPEEKIEHPLPATADASKGPLPALGDSDSSFSDALGEATGGNSITQYLVPESIIRHIAVTVDNLPRQKVAVEKRPVTPVAGTFMANGDELHSTLDSRNFERYEPMVEAIKKVDMARLAAVYVRFYPLFQSAYQDLGYPTGYFNDRLVQVIDLLLATPQVSGPIELVRPNVMYVFADPALEARPAGQKLLLRMGPDNAAVVKAKLTELRASITAALPKH